MAVRQKYSVIEQYGLCLFAEDRSWYFYPLEQVAFHVKQTHFALIHFFGFLSHKKRGFER